MSSGKEGLDIINERLQMIKQGHDPHKVMFKIIMLDYSMPEMDGPEVAQKIDQLFKNLKHQNIAA